ncbi:MAG: PAS domain S-box protein [bacterium]
MSKPDFGKSEAAIARQLGGEYLWHDNISIGMAILSSKKNVFLRVNRALCQFLGYSKKELLGQTVRDITHPDDLATTMIKIRQLHSGGRPYSRFEKRYLHKNGKIVWGEVNSSLVDDGSQPPQYRITQVVDITRRKETEEALQLSNESLRISNDRFRIALSGSPTVVFTQDRELRYTWICNIAPHFKVEDFLGKRDSDIFTPSEARRFMQVKRKVMKTGVGHREEVTIDMPAGKTFHDTITEPLRDGSGKITGVICATIEVTARKRLEERLKQTNDSLEQKVKDRTLRLRQLAEKLTRAEHTERRRVADILHEQLQQHLCGMKFRVSHLKEESSTPTLISWADQLVKDLDESIQLTRTLTTDLHPPVLSHLGIKNALEWLAADVRKKTGLSVIVRTPKRVPPISGELKTFAFEAVRELLLNVVKHTQAKTAELRLGSTQNDLIRIEVKDTGVGFDPKQSNEEGSRFGLFRIQERAESFGGRLEVASQPKKGTCVTLILPIYR